MPDDATFDLGAPRPQPFRLTARLLFGIGLLAVGVLWTLDNLGMARAGEAVVWWPVLAIFYGLARLTGLTARRGPMIGLVWIFAGVWMLLHNLGYVHPGLEALWPLFLVAIGFRILSGRGRWAYRVQSRSVVTGDDAGIVHCDVVMASVQRRVTVQDFRGAELNAVMGNVEMDLRGAGLAGGPVVIEASCVMGGIEILVPYGWRVVDETTSALGRVENHTRPVAAGTQAPTIVVRGSAIMGSIEIRH